jgi:hypothetical protein
MPEPVFDSLVLHCTYRTGLLDHAYFDWAGIVNYHVNVKGYDYVGYHRGIERVKGHLVECIGRPLFREGAHCLGMNWRAIGVAVIGNYDLEPPDRYLYFTIANVCKNYMLQFPAIAVDRIFGHNEFSTKTCPGRKFDVEKVRYLVRNTV